MSIWFCIPSIRPREEAQPRINMWRDLGYRVALLRQGDTLDCELTMPTDRYQGWARSVNILAATILQVDRTAEWIVSGGDDYEPDAAHSARDIVDACEAHFSGTFGVMQPTGDRWGDTPGTRHTFGADRGALIDRVAGSPWMGRDWCKRAYQGRGPLWAEYQHCFADEELQAVAERLGVFWQRRDLIQYHDHAMRKPGAVVPLWLSAQIRGEAWKTCEDLFRQRKAEGFPGSEPLGA